MRRNGVGRQPGRDGLILCVLAMLVSDRFPFGSNRDVNKVWLVMRSIVEGKVPWAFWPPGSNPPGSESGIWCQSGRLREDEDDAPSSEDERGVSRSDSDGPSDGDLHVETDENEEMEDVEEPEERSVAKATTGRFAALGMSDGGEGEEEDEDEDGGPNP
jgi:hypothetical protein